MKDAHQQIIETLATRKRVLITTHIRPDGDALGSTAAMHLAFTSPDRKKVDAVYSSANYRQVSLALNILGVQFNPGQEAMPTVPK